MRTARIVAMVFFAFQALFAIVFFGITLWSVVTVALFAASVFEFRRHYYTGA